MKIKNICILAGGDSTRFWPLEEKILTKFLGKQYLRYIIEHVNNFAETVCVVTNPENKSEIQAIDPKMKLILQKSSEGMGGAILACKNQIEGETLVLGNDLFDYSLLPHLFKKDSDMVLLAKKMDTYFPGGYLRLAGNKIQGIEEKPDPQKTPSNMVRLVADYIQDIGNFISIIEKIGSRTDSAYEQALTLVIQNKHATYETYERYWYPLKFPWHVLSIMEFFLGTLKEKKVGKNSMISENALITGPVHIGDNVKVGDFTKIAGPVYIGDNVIVGDHTLVRESHIGNGALVGGGTEVARSYVGENVYLHRNYVGDSVVDRDVLLASGTVTANYRFDGKSVFSKVGDQKIDSEKVKFGTIIGRGAKVGINCSIFPGVKIGKNTFVAPHESVESDLPDDSYFGNDQIKKNTFGA